ncbi:hypothetical protein N657DRAFT_8506 [Parathielavia appendiculata]|uniref:Uncharacterized protein n=1 Tax=Parathielavia appendiculata TaxID=2587402 RepID=A0AAN6UAY4_9PEZI|nr:hypothetical protein N657DRAFT_8506 [Parathielavia appendiculata]
MRKGETVCKQNLVPIIVVTPYPETSSSRRWGPNVRSKVTVVSRILRTSEFVGQCFVYMLTLTPNNSNIFAPELGTGIRENKRRQNTDANSISSSLPHVGSAILCRALEPLSVFCPSFALPLVILYLSISFGLLCRSAAGSGKARGIGSGALELPLFSKPPQVQFAGFNFLNKSNLFQATLLVIARIGPRQEQLCRLHRRCRCGKGSSGRHRTLQRGFLQGSWLPGCLSRSATQPSFFFIAASSARC